ncbi:dienelactone hydrolase family protein [Massilia oculi]|uniref:Dienelactone hydrolase family protein n=1 Tax=Massilia hydrophila TaxID=3044279 RepID=A0ABS7YDB8_9BURK|nr:dienelactone hydrolase family protein [Massilia oculi]MCA1856926.1 dienelactone hydrolase family protein [Massilia oculi]
MLRLIGIILIVLIGAPSHAQQAFPFHNKPGSFAVGFRVLGQVDPSRSYPAGAPTGTRKPRPIQTAIWYPAVKGGQAMRYDDYLQLLGWDDDFDRPPAERDKVLAEWLKIVTEGRSAEQIAAERRHVRWAVREAKALPGKYPVVIYSPSLSSNVFENAEMMELLASHGYVVIASPALGVDGRWQKDDLAHAETQAADIRFLVGYAQSLPQADTSRLAVAGFSWGGMANVLAAAQDERIKALVCLDGTVRYRHAMLEKIPYLKPAQLRTPLLYLAQRPAPFERGLKHKPDHSGSILQKMTGADVYLLTMYAMEHVYFGSSYLRLDPLDFGGYTRDEIAQSYALAGRYVLNFLNGALKGERSGFDYLMKKPEQLGMPRHSVDSQFFAARP